MKYRHLFDLEPEQCLKEAIMVNHSGEIGAKQIYLGQIMAAKQRGYNQQTINELLQMLESELKHHQYFSQMIQTDTKFNPSLLDGIWKPFSFALGYASAIWDIKIAMLLTKQVETVIEEHYSKQIKAMEASGICSNIISTIRQFLAEELEHKHIGDEQSRGLPHLPSKILEKLFEVIVKMAICVSSRV